MGIGKFLGGLNQGLQQLTPQQRAMLLRTAAATTRSPMAAKGFTDQAAQLIESEERKKQIEAARLAQQRQFAQQKQLQDERLAFQAKMERDRQERGQPVGDPFEKGSFLTSGIWSAESVAAAKKARDAGDPYWESKLSRVEDGKWTSKDAELHNEALQNARAADMQIAQLDSIGNELISLGSDFEEGLLGKGFAGVREALGEQSELDTKRRYFEQIRSSAVMASLPRGTSSDADMAFAQRGWPDSFEDREELYMFTQGMAKMAVVNAVYEQLKADVYARDGNLRAFGAEWQLNGDALVQRRFGQLGYTINRTGKGVYSDVVQSAWGQPVQSTSEAGEFVKGQIYTGTDNGKKVQAVYQGKDSQGNDIWEPYEEPEAEGGGW